MDWLFENLGKLAPIVVFILYMISSIKGKGQGEEEEVDPQAEERARRIQEEIRRKIRERQRSEQGPTAAPPEETIEFDDEPYAAPSASPMLAPAPLLREEAAVLPESSDVVDPFLRQKEEIDAKLAEARKLKERAQGNSRKRGFAQPIRSEKRSNGLRRQLLQGVSQKGALRTSVLLKEVLDKPVGLR